MTGNVFQIFHFVENGQVGSIREGGFSAYDDKAFWSNIPIPVFLISEASAERLKRLMTLRVVKVPRLGLQNATVLNEENEF
eukprot:gene23571-25060_t